MSRHRDPGPEGRRAQRWRNVVALAVTGAIAFSVAGDSTDGEQPRAGSPPVPTSICDAKTIC